MTMHKRSPEERNRRRQSSAAIMLRNLTLMITIMTITLGSVIIIAVGHQLLEEVGSTTAHMATSLKQTVIDGDDDWENFRRNSTLDTSTSYVYVHNKRKDAKQTQYFSPNTDKLLRVKPVKVPFIRHLYYRRGMGFAYHRMVHARGIYYTLWQSMQPQLAVLGRVIQITVIILIITLLITPLYIRRLTTRLTDPITTLSRTTRVIASSKEPGSMQLPVPKQPTEVTELATDFNDLLAMLNQRQEQQKLFVMNAAHELRTPIATIRSHTQLIERHGREHPEIIEKSVRYITEESRQMQQLIEELLTLSRADRLVLDVHDLDLTQTLQGIVDKISGTFEQELVAKIAPNVHVVADENALEQILTNLITNAAKYSPKTGKITVGLTNDNHPQITVKDTGSGISAADKPHIFERFYRSDDVRGSINGTGLGLAIAAQLTTLLNGSLHVADNDPHGAVFILDLPRTPAAKAAQN